MAHLERHDDARLHWERRGSGPLVVVAPMYNTPPKVLGGLVDELSADHAVVTYDLRGNGASSDGGPYDMATDADDLAALIEAAGPPAVVVGLGDGAHRGIHVAASHPQLVAGVVVSGSLLLNFPSEEEEDEEETAGLASSRSVLQAFSRMNDTDYRAAVRYQMESGNLELSEDQVRARVDEVVDYAPAEPASARIRAWTGDDISDVALAVADRLWVLHFEGNPWFPASLARRMCRQLPQAHFQGVEDGAMNRPDLTAAVVRGITATGDGGAAQRVGTGPAPNREAQISPDIGY